MIDKNFLETIISEWSYWDKPLPVSIPRLLLQRLDFNLSPDLVLVIQGVRRCGKSTLLSQLVRHFKLNPKQCTFINFEDPRLSQNLDHELLDVLVNSVPPKQQHFFFLDEIQEVQNWQKWLHRKVERPSHHYFIITGSNASLLSGELATMLTGRHRTLELFPFNYEEYKLAKPQSDFENYLEEGGFPRVLRENNPKALLREYFTDIIERDVKRHVAARASLPLFRLVKAVFESAGSEISQRSMAGMLGVSADTVGVYLAACQAAYLLLECPYFTFSERQKTARNRKYYPVDLGLRNAVATKTGSDQGKKLETVVFHHLRAKYKNVFFWRGKGEVDFVVSTQDGVTPYQVSWEGVKERHEKALDEFYIQYPQARPAQLITRQNVGQFMVD